MSNNEVIHLLGDQIRVLASTQQTNGAMTVVEVIASPGGGPPLHTHSQAEVFVCLDGQIEITLDGKIHLLSPGQAAVAPSLAPHTYRNPGAQPARMIVSITPGGLDFFFAELAQATAAGGPPDMGRVVEIASRHGVRFVGPPA